MTEAKHTGLASALPWRVVEDRRSESDDDEYIAGYNIIDRNNEDIVGIEGILGSPNDKASANLIVEAVNERPALLAVRDAAKALRDGQKVFPDAWHAYLEAALDAALKQAGAE